MAKRIYWESLKKWGLGTGLSGAGIASVYLLFAFLASSGVLDYYEHSGDVVCAGTLDDPCYAYITFNLTEDVYVYPLEYDPWGRNTPFEFQPGVKDWWLERSWGDGWARYDLQNGCTGTWCGAPNSDGAKYSFVWRAGKIYNIRIVALKHNPSEVIKWSAFNGEIDPYWLGLKADAPFKREFIQKNETKILENSIVSCTEEKRTYNKFDGYDEKTLSCPVINETCKDTYKITVPTHIVVNETKRICKEVGVLFNGKQVLQKTPTKTSRRWDDTYLCVYDPDDGGTYMEGRKGLCDSGETATCYDLNTKKVVKTCGKGVDIS